MRFPRDSLLQVEVCLLSPLVELKDRPQFKHWYPSTFGLHLHWFRFLFLFQFEWFRNILRHSWHAGEFGCLFFLWRSRLKLFANLLLQRWHLKRKTSARTRIGSLWPAFHQSFKWFHLDARVEMTTWFASMRVQTHKTGITSFWICNVSLLMSETSL